MDDIFRKAAKAALYAWKQDESGLEDLVNDIWVWYLESPETQRKLQAIEHHEAVKTVKNAALQMLSGQILAANRFNGRNLYSSEAVKDALLGVSDNRYLVDILPMAMDDLSEKNAGHAESIRSRYTDGVIPAVEGGGAMLLSRAVKSLTEHVNIIAITAGVDAEGNVSEGPGSKHSVFPGTRKSKGADHSDPTANMALELIDEGDEQHVLCAVQMADSEDYGRIPQPVRGPGGRFLNSAQTTTYRKEYLR
ncbi:RNA polymerase sigma factor [Mycobacterium phage Jeeves]|uniref:RNA polymerase sigma factor n=1 Tax=Mycobacterium phage Jeeves TaxID=2652402 RepID=A0A5J6T2Z5_9CAUD|nr:sigma-K factor [Mycobacterium phage Jeeves]QFG04533.1 RNA polymerase sigma factor [Mycobacterium phage Jeeves]